MVNTSLKWWTLYTSNKSNLQRFLAKPTNYNHHNYFKPLLPSPPPSFQKKLTLLSRHHHRYFENFLKKRKRKRKEKTIARFAASPPRLSSTPRMNLYDKYVELRVMCNCWQEKRKEKRGGTIENFENGEPRENAYRESSPLSVVDGRVVQGLNDEYTDRCRLKWKKDKPRARCVCKRRERERESEREVGKKVESGEKDTTETRSLKESGSDGAQTFSLSLAEVFRRFHGSA